MTLMTLIIVLVGVSSVVWTVIIYNNLVRSRNRLGEADSEITVQLKRRYDLVPTLIDTVKGYASHEKKVFQSVTEARTNAMNSQGKGQVTSQRSENMLADTLKTLFAVAEAYPDLKASQNFIRLQDELVDCEDRIQAARRLYNSTLLNYTNRLEVFPSNVVAGLFRFTTGSYEYFEVENKSQIAEPVKVNFE